MTIASAPPLSPAAAALIFEFEGIDQPSAWPGEESGITIGVGYDLGTVTESEFRADWGRHLPAAWITRLCAVIGKQGQEAARNAYRFQDIHITVVDAHAVFTQVTAPKFCAMTAKAFPGSALLPVNAFGALVSLVYNRGAATKGDSRREMNDIYNTLAAYSHLESITPIQFDAIADHLARALRSMKRLWEGHGQDGLIARREAEAKLIESCRPTSTVSTVSPSA